MDGIAVKCKTVGEVSSILVKYSLIDLKTEKVVARGQVQGEKIANSKFYNFKFDTVENCKGKAFEFILSTEGETQENKIYYCYESQTEKDTLMKTDNRDIGGTLIMRSVTNRFDLDVYKRQRGEGDAAAELQHAPGQGHDGVLLQHGGQGLRTGCSEP